MFLDLWSIAVLTSDLLELIVNYLESGTSFVVSVPFLVFLIGFMIVSAIAWRSTDIPELPSAPRPPYVIQITSTPTLNNNGERNSLADVRLLSSGVDVDNVLRRFPPTNVHFRAGVSRVRISETRVINTNTPTSTSATSSSTQVGPGHLNSSGRSETSPQGTRTNIRVYQSQGQRQAQAQTNGVSGSSLLGLLRPSSVIQPFLQRNNGGSNQTQNVIVYHRVNVYHHHHYAQPSPTTTSQQPPPETQNHQQHSQIPNSNSPPGESVPIISVTSESTARSVSTTTTSETVTNDPSIPSPDVIPSPYTEYSFEETSQVTEAETVAEDTALDTVGDEVRVEGVRLRRSVAFSTVDNSTSTIAGSETGTASLDKTETEGDQVDQSLMEQSNNLSNEEGVINDIRFTIRFLNDTQKEVTSHLGEKIVDFKRRHFATELSENKNVRLIFNGRVLDNDNSTVRDSGIFDQCVVHCLIVSRNTPGAGPGSNNSATGTSQTPQNRANGGFLRGGTVEPGIFFVGFIGVFLVFLWFVCFHFGQHLFTQSAVISLTVLTGIFLVGLVAFYLPVHPPINPTQ